MFSSTNLLGVMLVFRMYLSVYHARISNLKTRSFRANFSSSTILEFSKQENQLLLFWKTKDSVLEYLVEIQSVYSFILRINTRACIDFSTFVDKYGVNRCPPPIPFKTNSFFLKTEISDKTSKKSFFNDSTLWRRKRFTL